MITLAQGIENKIDMIIKAKGSVDPIVLDPSDTFSFKLIDYKDVSTVFTLTTPDDIALDLVTPETGLITITIPVADATLMKFALRPVEDGNIPKTRYFAVLDCNTVALGKMRVHIAEIKVIPHGV